MIKIYEWDAWFEKDHFVLKRGSHYDVSQSSMSQQVRNAASQRGLGVVVMDQGSQLRVVVTYRSKHATA